MSKTVVIWLRILAGIWLSAGSIVAAEALAELERLARMDPKPFVLVESQAGETVTRGQGVVIGNRGLVLSVGHVTWVEAEKQFSDRFSVHLRSHSGEVPEGFAHQHKTRFTDRENQEFFQFTYPATLLKTGESRFVDGGDIAVFRMKAETDLPKMAFFSTRRPRLKIGETLHLCHYQFPHKKAEPTFLISPLKVVGMAQTSSGLQYLAEGFYRVGSSGGAILKNGRLIGIQSAAYTTNGGGGEAAAGLVSFRLVWSDLFKPFMQEK